MLLVRATPRAILLQRDAIRVIAFVFFRVIVALATVGARQRDEDAICFLGHGWWCPLGDSLENSGSEPKVRIELTTSPLPRVCSTTELLGQTPRDSNKWPQRGPPRGIDPQPFETCLALAKTRRSAATRDSGGPKGGRAQVGQTSAARFSARRIGGSSWHRGGTGCRFCRRNVSTGSPN